MTLSNIHSSSPLGLTRRRLLIGAGVLAISNFYVGRYAKRSLQVLLAAVGGVIFMKAFGWYMDVLIERTKVDQEEEALAPPDREAAQG
jgi:hypothetical protein